MQSATLARVFLLAALVAVAALGHALGAPHSHALPEEHSVLRALPASRKQLDSVVEYLTANPDLDVWSVTRKLGRPIDVQVSAAQQERLVGFLEAQGVEHRTFIGDLHSAVEKHLSNVRQRGVNRAESAFNWKTYYPLEEIYAWMEGLEKANPGLVSVVDVGKSYENRSIKGLVIKFGSDLPVAMVESGIHAREWIAHASATFFIDQILNSAEDDVVRQYEWHIFPTVNPDGYVYTWNEDRNWRKTRSRNGRYYGVDANRNWPFHWLEGGATSAPNAETYAGPHAESEAETRNLRKYVDGLASRMHAYISLHAYSQLLMFPWGYTNKHVNAHDELYKIASKAIDAVTAVAGTQYDYGNIADTIYVASGNTIDYVYSKCVPYPFVFELRDSGEYGFLLPPDQIEEAAGEAWAGVRVIVDEAFKAGVPDRNPDTC